MDRHGTGMGKRGGSVRIGSLSVVDQGSSKMEDGDQWTVGSCRTGSVVFRFTKTLMSANDNDI